MFLFFQIRLNWSRILRTKDRPIKKNKAEMKHVKEKKSNPEVATRKHFIIRFRQKIMFIIFFQEHRKR